MRIAYSQRAISAAMDVEAACPAVGNRQEKLPGGLCSPLFPSTVMPARFQDAMGFMVTNHLCYHKDIEALQHTPVVASFSYS